jgi:hypothetical protein
MLGDRTTRKRRRKRRRKIGNRENDGTSYSRATFGN